MKKGRHRRFEEARKLKQAGPSAFDLGLGGEERRPRTEEDEYAALAEKYGVVFDDDDDIDDDDIDDEPTGESVSGEEAAETASGSSSEGAADVSVDASAE